MKLLAFDLDGTALLSHTELSPATRSALEAAAQKGIHIVPATGRMKNFIPEPIMGVKGIRYALTSNGAAVYDLQEDTRIYENLLSNEKTIEAQTFLNRFDLYVEYYNGGNAFMKKGYPEQAASRFGIPEERIYFTTKPYTFISDYIPFLKETGFRPEKINMPYVRPELWDIVWNGLNDLGGLNLTSSIKGNIEVNGGTADKGDGLRALASVLGIEAEEVMAVGDNGNDIAMLKYAGISVAMGNATEEAKKAAKYQTASNREDGLAKAIERFLL